MRQFFIKYYSILLFLGISIACNQEKKSQERKVLPPVQIEEEKVSSSAGKEADYDALGWGEILESYPHLILDLKYATSDNFVKEAVYDCPRCFLRPEVADALHSVRSILKKKGLGIKLYDCYRPHSVQKKLWEKIPDPRYVTNPSKGSMHNRGMAVDITIVDADGNELDMGTPFDHFGYRAYHTCTQLSDKILQNRRLLKNTMEESGFRSIRTEWWHYSYVGKSHLISDMQWKCDDE